VHHDVVRAGPLGKHPVGRAGCVGQGDGDAGPDHRRRPRGQFQPLRAALLGPDPPVVRTGLVGGRIDLRPQPVDPAGEVVGALLLSPDQVTEVAAGAPQLTAVGRPGAGGEQDPGRGEGHRSGHPPERSHR
jgi:hypothetical protein